MFTTIQSQIYDYAYPIVMVLGIIGNLFILILFNRQRHNACSIYLVNAAVTNLLYLPSSYFLRAFSVPYNNGSIGVLVFCKFSNYIPGFLGQVFKTILILACIDRYLMTSHRATFRAFSTPKRAKYLVFFSYVFWAIAASHQAIFSTISNGQCTRVGLYATIFGFYGILFVGLTPSIVLSIFACLTYRNMKHLRRRIQPMNQGVGNTNHIFRRRDRDLVVLVIAEAIVYVISTALFPAVLIEMMISQYVLPAKSLYYSLMEVFVYKVALFLLYILSATSFYVYLISSASFRRDFQQLMVVSYRKLRRQPIDQPALQMNQTMTRQVNRV